MYLGDNFIVGGITGLVAEFPRTRPDAQIMLTWVSYPRSFGVTELDESGRVIGLEEKPRAPKSDLALVGVYLFAPVASTVITGYWKDTGSVADMLEVNRLVLEKVRISS
jgi:glucose-1-phosphate thymidylyltransferase